MFSENRRRRKLQEWFPKDSENCHCGPPGQKLDTASDPQQQEPPINE